MSKFDEFLNIDDNLEENYIKTALRYVKIFLSKIYVKKIDDAAVKFVKQPFLEVLIAFKIGNEIVRLDEEYIKLKSLKQYYDSLLANIFNKLSYDQIDRLCQKLKENILQIYKK